jgi:hypothetical protein
MHDLTYYISALEKHYGNATCRGCDCFQGLLTQLKLDYQIDNPSVIDDMTLPRMQQHQCLGCDPCPPAELFTKYIHDKHT